VPRTNGAIVPLSRPSNSGRRRNRSGAPRCVCWPNFVALRVGVRRCGTPCPPAAVVRGRPVSRGRTTRRFAQSRATDAGRAFASPSTSSTLDSCFFVASEGSKRVEGSKIEGSKHRNVVASSHKRIEVTSKGSKDKKKGRRIKTSKDQTTTKATRPRIRGVARTASRPRSRPDRPPDPTASLNTGDEHDHWAPCQLALRSPSPLRN